jgi:type IX secretion system PorP/SprF family membrane protein
MKKIFFSFFFLLACISLVKAQDPNFSQFFASPLTMNPALTGKFDGVYRVAGNYRNQWPTINNAFTTTTASVDLGIMGNKLPQYDQFGIGFMGFSDKSGNGVLQNNAAAFSLAYHKALDENGFHQIGAGFQTSFVNKRLDVTKVVFEDQLTPLGFTGVTSEIFSNDQLNIKYLDVNTGVFYNGSTNGYNNFYFGASIYHINRPTESFQGANFILDTRTTLQAGGKIPVSGFSNYLHISANHSFQANARNTIIGAAYSLNTNGDDYYPINVYLGTWYRFADAIIPYVGLEFGDFHFGASYDINTSSLKPGSNSRGGAEISLIYIKKHVDPNARKLNCPKF